MGDRVAKDRLDKLNALRAKGIAPYPPRVPVPEPVEGCLSRLEQRRGETATVAGRLTQFRDFGKLRFSHLWDRTGRIQVGFQRDRLPEFWPDRKKIEANDLVVVTGNEDLTSGEATQTVELPPPGPPTLPTSLKASRGDASGS